MTTQTNNEICISIPSENENSTERVSGKTEGIWKTTIIRGTKRRTLEGIVAACLYGRFKEHGSSRWFRKGSFTRPLLWITAVVCMTILIAYQAANVGKYLSKQEVIVHSETKNQKSVPFPSVTICSQEPFQKNKIKDYYMLLTSTTLQNAVKDFDAIWAIYYLEEALKFHGKQPSCEDSLSMVQCSLKPTQSCEGQEDSLYARDSNFRKLRRQRSVENNVIPNIDNVMTSLCSDFVWNSWLPDMINSGEESDIMRQALINECLLRYNEDRYTMSMSSKYYDTHSLWLWSDSRLYLNSADWWVGSSIIDYGLDFSYRSENDSLLLFPVSRGFFGDIAHNVVNWWFDSSTYSSSDSSSDSIGLLTNIWYFASILLGSLFNWNDDRSDMFFQNTDNTTFNLGDYTLELLYSYFPEFTYNEVFDLWQAYIDFSSSTDVYQAVEMMHSYNALEEDTLQTLYSYYPGYTYNELSDMRQFYSAISLSTVLYLSDSDEYNTLLLYFGNSEYTNEELMANLDIYSSLLPLAYSMPDSSFSDISSNRPVSSYWSTPLSLDSFSASLSELSEQGFFSQNMFSPLGKEMSMLDMLFESQSVDAKDLMQWSSINTKQIENFGFTYSEMIAECSYNREACDLTDFTKWKNDRYGNCFTFNSEVNAKTKVREADTPGQQNGLKLVLNTMEEGHRGFRLSIHHPMEVPIPEENGIDISTEEISLVPTSMQHHERLQKPEGTCKEMNWALEGSQTLHGCIKMCHEEMIRLNCQCKKTMLPMNADTEEQLPQCGFNNMKCLMKIANRYNKESCSHCLAPCHEVTYNTELVRIENRRANDRCTNRSTVRPNEFQNAIPSVIHVYLETLQMENLTEKLSCTLQDMIKDTGFWMYLLLGVSMLSLLDFILELLILLLSKTNNIAKHIYKEKTATIKYQREGY